MTFMQNGASERRWILSPIEIKSRELWGKVLLACVAAEGGYAMLFGRLRKSDLAYLPRGIYLDKSINNKRPAAFEYYRQLGERITAWDDEGLIYLSPEIYKERVIPQALAQADYFFCWGSNQAGIVRATVPEMQAKVIETGHPRFDLLRPELRGIFATETQKLRETHGSFWLVNTNFSWVNHAYKPPDELLASLVRVREVSMPETHEVARQYIDYEQQVMDRFVLLLADLSRAFPERFFVLRPHPGENRKRWEEVCAPLPNVRVILEGNVIPWILAADALIHNNCTTGVEAFLLDKPVVAFCPFQESEFDFDLPNAVSVPVQSAAELCDTLAAGRRDGYAELVTRDYAGRRAHAAKYIAAMDGPLAAERIVDAFSQLDVEPRAFDKAAFRSWGRHAAKAVPHAKSLVSRALRGNAAKRYQQQKFPGLEPAEVDELIRRFQRVTGRFEGVQAEQLGKGLFRIHRD